MKRLFLFIFSCNLLFASYVMPFKAGWQLVGVSQDMADMSLFDRDEVRLIWSYDAETQSWQGYSPDASVAGKLVVKGVEPLNTLSAHQGFWINNKKAWSLQVEEDGSGETPKGELTLLKGWNLVSLPVNMSISPKLFGDATLWTYGSDEWELLNSPVLEENLSTTYSISNLNGFWVQSDSNKTIDLPEKVSELHTFESTESMKAYVRKMKLDYLRPNYGYITDPYFYFIAAEGGSAGPGSGAVDDTAVDGVSEVDNVTTTNIQEEDVDEHDVVKNDAEKLFYLDIEEQTVYVTTFSRLLSGDVTPEANITIETYYPYYMYLYNDRLMVLSKYWGSDKSNRIDTYDVSDLFAIRKLNSITIDGTSIEKTRRVGNRVFLINSYSPQMTVEYPKLEATIDTQTCEDAYYAGTAAPEECYYLRYDWENGNYYRYDYDHPTIVSEKLLPMLYSETNGTTEELVKARKFYAPYKYDQYPMITMVTELNIASGEAVDTIAYLGSVRQEYASSSALYLISSEYHWFNGFNSYSQRSTIYKFDYTGPLQFKGRGSVGGTTLNQFSVSEYNDVLRIATTEWSSAAGVVNTLYCLQEADGSLESVGNLSGLGKEGETIRSVRFVGDKGFVVTFRQTDPFYTLDLSDPANPKKVGELAIPGFSEYMHPVDASRILAIGRDADENGIRAGLQVQLFDISDFANPTLADKITIGDRYTYSEAEYNHKAFAYRSSDKLFGIPYVSYYGGYGDHQLGIFQLEDNNTISSLATQTMARESYSWGDRGTFFDYNGSRYSVLSGEGNLSIINIDTGE